MYMEAYYFVTKHGGLNENDPYRIVCLNFWFPVRGTVSEGVKGVALVGEGVTLVSVDPVSLSLPISCLMIEALY